jgi:hypothetical protein
LLESCGESSLSPCILRAFFALRPEHLFVILRPEPLQLALQGKLREGLQDLSD